jgi:hypothetical protein
MIFQVPIKVVDFEKDRMAFSLERAKVMLFVGVVSLNFLIAESITY